MSQQREIRRFVSQELRRAADLSLTQAIVRERYLIHCGRDQLSQEERQLLKRVVEQELVKMQDQYSSSDDEPLVKKLGAKRKREEGEEEEQNKRPRRVHSHPESPDSGIDRAGKGDSEGERDCDEEEEEEDGGPAEAEESSPEREGDRARKTQAALDSDSKSESETETGKSRETGNTEAAAEKSEGEEPQLQPQDGSDSDSDSSSRPSLDDDEERGGRRTAQAGSGRARDRGTEEHKSISRLKRYIALCGVRRNYKRLLEGCKSVKSKVNVLRQQLEDLGVKGNPSIEKCKRARVRRERAQELAELDLSNIIETQGRPRRRAASAWDPSPSGSDAGGAFRRSVESDSDSGGPRRGGARGRATDWSNLRGVISDDADSD
ncbi:HIRA-interacting protein 3 isoform X2 [Lepisosteus oculatus]|uniref:HIRA-interacting protein 3 isoform X2 n=1 Tax=Lepisosteus oculatus TaxID=7918 RepID=UPI003720F42C